MKLNKYSCGHCGGHNISRKMWQDVNLTPGDPIELTRTDDWEYWCNDCQAYWAYGDITSNDDLLNLLKFNYQPHHLMVGLNSSFPTIESIENYLHQKLQDEYYDDFADIKTMVKDIAENQDHMEEYYLCRVYMIMATHEIDGYINGPKIIRFLHQIELNYGMCGIEGSQHLFDNNHQQHQIIAFLLSNSVLIHSPVNLVKYARNKGYEPTLPWLRMLCESVPALTTPGQWPKL